MHHRQRGALSLFRVALVSAGLAAAAMAALFSMRAERNLFAEGWQRLVKGGGAAAVAHQVQAAPAAGVLRRCLINGKTVFSDVDCGSDNQSAKIVVLHQSRGIDAPKAPPPTAPAAATMQDNMIEKATR